MKGSLQADMGMDMENTQNADMDITTVHMPDRKEGVPNERGQTSVMDG